MQLHMGSFIIGYLYLSEIDRSGTLILGRLAYRWGSHRSIGRGHRFQWYGSRRWRFFM
jgi:hypothetical protein